MAAKKAKNAVSAAADQSRADILQGFLKEMAKDRPGEVRTLDDDTALDIDVFSTGALSLDVALGVGGIPRGRLTEIYGPSGGGKTTLALAAAVNCQRGGGNVGFVDAEHALSRELALNMGVDPATFVTYQPTDGEDAIEMVCRMLDSRAFDMIVVDSVASMTPRAEMENDIEQQGMAYHARLMSKFMRRVVSKVNETNTALVLLNQVRVNLGSYGAPDTTTGGKAIPFYATIRVEVRTSNSKRIERNKEFIGTTVTAKVTKNKLASPFKVAEYDLIFGKGIEASSSLLAVALQLGLVSLNGATYTDVVTGQKLGIGKEKVRAVIDADPELAARLTEAVYERLRAKKVPGAERSDEEAGSVGYEGLEEPDDEFENATDES